MASSDSMHRLQIWKLIKETSTEIKIGNVCHILPLIIHHPKQEKTYIVCPTGRCFPLYYPSRRKADTVFAWQQLSQWDCHNQPMKSHCTRDSHFPPMDSVTASSQHLPFLYKRSFLSFVLQHWHSLHVLNCNSLLLLK